MLLPLTLLTSLLHLSLQHEDTGAFPSDLDACGGHYGTVPAWTATDGSGDAYPAANNVYHCKGLC